MARPETMERYEKVKLLISEGKSLKQACRDVGTNSCGWFYGIDQKMKGKRSLPAKKIKYGKPKVIDIPQTIMPVNNTGKMMMLIGSQAELLDFAKGLQ